MEENPEVILLNCSSSSSLNQNSTSSWWCLVEDTRHCPDWNISSENLLDICFSQSKYLEKYLGPRRSPLFLPICLIYLLIFLVGAVGNLLTCIVISRYCIMQTPTNLYLFSLAMSDLLVLLLGMPLELYEMWSNYPFLLGLGGCYFRTLLFEMVCFASVLNVTALSVERYMAVVFPLQVKRMATRKHAKQVTSALWLLSFLCAIPNASLHGIIYLPPRFGQSFPQSAICGVAKPVWIYKLLVQLTALIFFLVPMVTMAILYLLIGVQLHREKTVMQQVTESSMECKASGSHPNNQSNQHRQITKMLCVLVLVFAVSWAPFHLDRVMWSYIEDWTLERARLFEWVHVLSGVFFYLSSVVNPILYNLMSSRFREMFREVMCPSIHRRLSFTTQLANRSSISDRAV